MKYIIFTLIGFILSIFFVFNSYAGEVCEAHTEYKEIESIINVVDTPPEYLKDATIVVKLVNGKEHSFPANNFKVVKRLKEVTETNLLIVHEKTCVTSYKNRVAVLVGKGPKDSLDKQISVTQVDISNTQGEVLGLQYQRSLTDRLNLGLQVQSNKTNSLMLGLDF